MNISCCIICLLFYCILYTEQNYKRNTFVFAPIFLLLKCAVLLYWRGPGGSENHSVSGVTTICLTQCNTSPSHRVDQVVDCGLWKVGPLLFNGCWKFLDIGRNWNTPCIIMLQHEVMVGDEWHNNGPQDLFTVSLCIQNAINKMPRVRFP